MMQPRIEAIKEKTLVGMFETMSLADNKTFKLFSTFMSRKKEILNPKSIDVLDLQVYPKGYFLNFSSANYFTKWVLVEVADFDKIPIGMKPFTLPSGQYAVFTASIKNGDNSIFNYIFTEWLPNSEYVLDERPHFDVLGEKNQRRDPDAEQEIWIPIR